MTTPLQLFVDAQYVSPFAMSAYVALKEKEAAFEVITIDLSHGAQFDPNYTSKSLTSRVPTLIHGDFALSESSAITEYIDEVFPDRIALYPKATKPRARARQIQAWLRTDLMPIRQERSSEYIFCEAKHAPLSPAAVKAAEKLFSIADILLTEGSGSLFPDWSIVDTELALMLNRLVKAGDTVPEALRNYAHAQWLRPSVKSWVGLPRTI